jgi:hypothetical protein
MAARTGCLPPRRKPLVVQYMIGKSSARVACTEKMIASAGMRARVLGNEVHRRLLSGTWVKDFPKANPELKKLMVRRVDEKSAVSIDQVFSLANRIPSS